MHAHMHMHMYMHMRHVEYTTEYTIRVHSLRMRQRTHAHACASIRAHTRGVQSGHAPPRAHACRLSTPLCARVQESVEGLSVVAITYYSTGVLGYLAKAADAMGWLPLPVEVTLGACVPLLGVSVYLGLHRLKANVVGGKGGRGH